MQFERRPYEKLESSGNGGHVLLRQALVLQEKDVAWPKRLQLSTRGARGVQAREEEEQWVDARNI